MLTLPLLVAMGTAALTADPSSARPTQPLAPTGLESLLGTSQSGATPPATTTAPPATPAAPADEDALSVSITPYMWMYGIDGTVRIQNQEADFDIGFDDLVDALDLALMIHTEVWKGRFGIYVDPAYGKLESSTTISTGDINLDTEMWLVEFGVLYRALDTRSASGRQRFVDATLGGRYMYLKNEIDFPVVSDQEASDDFIDLTVGARYGMEFTEKIGMLVGGDIGGFGIGSSSEFAWNVQGLAYLGIGSSSRLWAGYRYLDVDRDDGGSYGLDFNFSGPLIGFEFRL